MNHFEQEWTCEVDFDLHDPGNPLLSTFSPWNMTYI